MLLLLVFIIYVLIITCIIEDDTLLKVCICLNARPVLCDKKSDVHLPCCLVLCKGALDGSQYMCNVTFSISFVYV
jgi:hypothetical protein